ncbi:hypothetical protein M8C21_026119 [Ambrosia artemisiifolia]|uniref:Uncharacterized protein n=1 Tax=Ambrosia artemisiifolia TaxID=4212 RepID=A0AAD5GTV1_AMBAR|nr:hypothetical protein M8C21_026119 [Ambrosia artemisiifolia]
MEKSRCPKEKETREETWWVQWKQVPPLGAFEGANIRLPLGLRLGCHHDKGMAHISNTRILLKIHEVTDACVPQKVGMIDKGGTNWESNGLTHASLY